jgi:hypothetical protein
MGKSGYDKELVRRARSFVESLKVCFFLLSLSGALFAAGVSSTRNFLYAQRCKHFYLIRQIRV